MLTPIHNFWPSPLPVHQSGAHWIFTIPRPFHTPNPGTTWWIPRDTPSYSLSSPPFTFSDQSTVHFGKPGSICKFNSNTTYDAPIPHLLELYHQGNVHSTQPGLIWNLPPGPCHGYYYLFISLFWAPATSLHGLIIWGKQDLSNPLPPYFPKIM